MLHRTGATFRCLSSIDKNVFPTLMLTVSLQCLPRHKAPKQNLHCIFVDEIIRQRSVYFRAVRSDMDTVGIRGMPKLGLPKIQYKTVLYSRLGLTTAVGPQSLVGSNVFFFKEYIFIWLIMQYVRLHLHVVSTGMFWLQCNGQNKKIDIHLLLITVFSCTCSILLCKEETLNRCLYWQVQL